MAPRSPAAIAFGVMGVYFMAESIPNLVGSMLIAPGESQPLFRWWAILGAVLRFACGVAVLVFRRRLAALLSPATEPADERSGTGGIQAAAIAVIGVFFFASGLQ